MSRHGAPVRATHRIALTMRRLLIAGRAFRPRSGGRSGAIGAHCSFAQLEASFHRHHGAHPAADGKASGNYANRP
jgi:hypothetical protein